MLQARTLKILAAVIALYGLLLLAAYQIPSFAETIGWYLVMFPLLSVYLFHHFGVPGLLEHGGACGWAPCSPTPFGYAFLGVLWLAAAWLAAWGIARLFFRGAPR